MNNSNVIKVKKCRVCGSIASVFYNYSGLSCKSCKKFFQRSASFSKHKEFICLHQNACPIDLPTRRQCQKCRWQKCLHIGMNPNLVDASKIFNKKQKIMTKLKKDRKDLLNLHEQKRLTQLRSAFSWIALQNTGKFHYSRNIETLIECVNCNQYFARRFVRFCKEIPEFNLIGRSDQLILLKQCYSEVCTVATAFYYDLQREGIPVFGNAEGEMVYFVDCYKISRQFTQDNIFDASYMRYCIKLRRAMDSDATVKDLLLVQLLFNPNRSNLTCPEFVHYNRTLYRYLLMRYLEQKYPSNRMKARRSFDSLGKSLSQIDASAGAIKRMMRVELCELKEQIHEILTEIYEL